MRVAVCFSGGLRNFKHTFLNFNKYLITPLNADVFLYGCENKDGVKQNIEDFNILFKPKSFIINNKRFYEKLSNDYPGILKSFIPQMFNIKECYELVKDYENKNNFKYDIIIRARLDCFFFREITNNEIESAVSGKLIMPIEWAFKEVHPLAETDQFLISNRKNYEIYTSLYENIYDYYPNINHPESIIGCHINKKNLIVEHIKRHYVFEYFNSDPMIEPIGFRAMGDWNIDNGWNEHNFRKSFD
jgi:hypothetical protein